ncbi:hypothetical protein R6Z07F_004941 [Ovis aries]
MVLGRASSTSRLITLEPQKTEEGDRNTHSRKLEAVRLEPALKFILAPPHPREPAASSVDSGHTASGSPGQAAMAVEGGMKCVKFLLYVLLLAFCACAVGLIAVGVATQLVLNQTMTRGATPSFLLPVVIIAVGAFLFLVAFVGCCGACKENYCLMITFAIFLSLIMLVEVAAAIAGYVFRDKVRSEFNKDFRQQMKNYPKANETASILDKMQKDFKCCGAANYTDWEKIPTMASRVPDSCCVNITNNCGVHFVVKDIHTEGCVEKIAAWLRKNVLVVAAAALGIAFVEILGIVLACCLVKSIRSGYEVM